MSRPKTPTIRYTGASPEEIKAQQAQQQALLAQQEERFKQQYTEQQQQLQAAYENSIGILTAQMQQRDSAQTALNQQLNTQLQLVQQNFDQTKGLYQGLLDKQQAENERSQAEQNKAFVQSGDVRKLGIQAATATLNNASARRGAAAAARSQRGSLAAYGNDVNLMGLLR